MPRRRYCPYSPRHGRGIRGLRRTCSPLARLKHSSADGSATDGCCADGFNHSSRWRCRVAKEPIVSERVGLVLGSVDATPLEFWVGVEEGRRVQLDDTIVVETQLSDGASVRYFGVVDLVRKRYEGAQFDTDAFRVA